MLTRFCSLLVVCAIPLLPKPVQAVTIGGNTYDDQAFAAKLNSANGTFAWLEDGPEPSWISYPVFTLPGSSADFATLQAALVGSNLDTAGEIHEFSSVDLAFGSRWPVNAAGADVVVFELGVPEPLRLTHGGISKTYMPVSQGFSTPHGALPVNAAYIDLSDFGVSVGQSAETISLSTIVTGDGWDAPDIAAVVAANSVLAPEPAAVCMFLVTFGAACIWIGRWLTHQCLLPRKHLASDNFISAFSFV